MSSGIVPLSEAGNARLFGGKAASLARAHQAGLPTPPGFALSAESARLIDAGERRALNDLRTFYRQLGGLVAVRSSAIGEDGEAASFAGQHLTELGVKGELAVLTAVFSVVFSAKSEGAMHYRRLRAGAGGEDETGMAVVIQRQLDPRAAGVLFTRNPVTGAEERVVEVAFGLGEAVVASLVTPDFIRFARGGAFLESRPGAKPFSLHPLEGGGVERRPNAEPLRPALAASDFIALDRLAELCERAYGPGQDIEFAFADEALHLLQCRPITTRAS